MIRLTSLFGAPVVWTVAAPVALLAQEHGAEGGSGSLFSVDLGLSLWTVVIFAGLLFILWKFAWGPILDAVNAREEKIRRDLDEAAREREEAERLLAEHKKQLAETHRKAQEILAEARQHGDELRKEMEEKAREEGQRIMDGARREIEREKDRALDEIRGEAVDLALAAASRLLKERMDQEKDRKLVADYLDDLGDGEGSARA